MTAVRRALAFGPQANQRYLGPGILAAWAATGWGPLVLCPSGGAGTYPAN
jgi:hypothetical protein